MATRRQTAPPSAAVVAQHTLTLDGQAQLLAGARGVGLDHADTLRNAYDSRTIGVIANRGGRDLGNRVGGHDCLSGRCAGLGR